MEIPPKLAKTRYWITLLLAFVGPGTFAELLLYILEGDISAWHHLAAAIFAGLISVTLFFVMKGPQFDPINQPVLPRDATRGGEAVGDGRPLLLRTRIVTQQQVGFASLALVVILVCLTLLDTPLGWWRWFNGDNGVAARLSPSKSKLAEVPLIPTITPMPTPTPVRPLGDVLETAKSVSSSYSRGAALVLVVEAALDQRDYLVAIEAGSAIPSSSTRSTTLNVIARCAAFDRQYRLANVAARNIPRNLAGNPG